MHPLLSSIARKGNNLAMLLSPSSSFHLMLQWIDPLVQHRLASQQAWNQQVFQLANLQATSTLMGKDCSMDLGRFAQNPIHKVQLLQLHQKLCVFKQTSFSFAQVPKLSTFLEQFIAKSHILLRGNQHASCPSLCPFPCMTFMVMMAKRVKLVDLEVQEQKLLEEPDQKKEELEPVRKERRSHDHHTTLVLIYQGKADTFLNI